MGKTSILSRFNLPGRFAWMLAESVGPLNLLFIIYTLPRKLHPPPSSPTSFLFTGLPAQNELLGLLYVAHYINRACVTPLLAPSMSPIHVGVAFLMATFQFLNSSNIASWLCYSTLSVSPDKTVYPPVLLLGLVLFLTGLALNISAEHTLFSLRRGAAVRKAKSEGKAVVSYEKVYVIPPAEGLYARILYPHYAAEWFEWIGYWVFGGAVGLGWETPAMWFVVAEVASMAPRAVEGKKWYVRRFGEGRVGRRGAVVPGLL
jgi:3-oxo-5-alpha-steroid 4-dehydrogenase 1